MSDYLFVYGTLMRAARHLMYARVADHADYVDEASFAGRLYLVHHYPGAVDAVVTGETVHGELHRLRDVAAFAALDEYEGCGPDAPQPAEYVRVLRDVVRPHGEIVTTWIYLYNLPVGQLPLIPSGRFLPLSSE